MIDVGYILISHSTTRSTATTRWVENAQTGLPSMVPRLSASKVSLSNMILFVVLDPLVGPFDCCWVLLSAVFLFFVLASTAIGCWWIIHHLSRK